MACALVSSACLPLLLATRQKTYNLPKTKHEMTNERTEMQKESKNEKNLTRAHTRCGVETASTTHNGHRRLRELV